MNLCTHSSTIEQASFYSQTPALGSKVFAVPETQGWIVSRRGEDRWEPRYSLSTRARELIAMPARLKGLLAHELKREAEQIDELLDPVYIPEA